ncbi:rod shape-determining protein MreC [Thermodesulfobacteriota bacterium]
MFSRKTVMIVGLVVAITVNIIVLSFSARHRQSSYAPGRFAISFVAPFQDAVTRSARFFKNIWSHYFFLVSVTSENENLKISLSQAIEKNNQLNEIERSNIRLRNLLNFRKSLSDRFLAAEIIGKDPSLWFKAVIVDKGKADGLKKGLPVVVSEGIVGQITDVSYHQSKVLLIIDQNSAVDALVQRTRARGIIEGKSTDQCFLKYVLRKHDIQVGDPVVSSGLDGVFPKGLRIGHVSGVIKRNSGIFQEVMVTPYVDFEKLEEVLVILESPKLKSENGQ